MNKILVSDYDETFYTDEKSIEINKKAIKEFIDDKNIFIIATGRSFLDFKNVYNKYNFYYDYVILNHGSTILDNKDNIIFNSFIDNNIIDSLKKDLKIESSIRHFCCSQFESRIDFDHKDLTKINIKYNSNVEALNIMNLIKDKYKEYINVFNISNSKLEIVSKESNKSKAISLISNKLNININNIYTIGNGYSDIEMVKNFNGYCMKNSIQELKDIAIKEYNNVYELIEDI